MEDIKKVSTSSSLKHYLGYGLLLLVSALFLRFYIQEKEGRIRGEEQVKAQQELINQRDSLQKQFDAKMDAQIKAVKTPQQALPIIRKNAVEPVLSVPASQLSPQVVQQLPDAPQVKPDTPLIILGPTQQVELAQKALGCEKAKGDLTSCEEDKKNLQKQVNILQKEVKGGSVLHKVTQALKCIGFDGATAGLGALIDKKSPTRGAAIGGAAGETACRLFF